MTTVKTLTKACAILRLVAGQKQPRMRELARLLGLPSSTAHRILRALEEMGLVQQVEPHGGYKLGSLIRELAEGDSRRRRLIEVARPYMVRLRDKCDETIALHVFEGRERVVIDQVESTQQLRRTITNLGAPMPLHAGAASKLFLASLSDRDVARHLEEHPLTVFTADTPADRQALLGEVRGIRRKGYAVSFQEITPGVASIAMPITVGSGQVTTAVSISGPMFRLTPAALRQVRPLLAETADDISRALGRELGGREKE